MASTKFWGFRRGRDGAADEFVFLANANGTSSCRRFDAQSGRLLGYTTSRGLPYEQAYAGILQRSEQIQSPAGARTEDMKYGLPRHMLADLRRRAELPVTDVSQDATVLSPRSRGGMLSGLSRIINDALKLDDVEFGSKTAAVRLSSTSPSIDGRQLLRQLYERIQHNWDGCPGRSDEIWRWRPMMDRSAENTSLEKTLEKAIATWCSQWVNQIPTASGLLRDYEERLTNIDLGRKYGPSQYEFVELKFGENAGTPVGAAFQIVRYGLLYCFCRLNRSRLDLPRASDELFAATRIDLKVLAPFTFYDPYRLEWLGDALDTGLRGFCNDRFGSALEMRFAFESFPGDFHWPGTEPRKLPGIMERRYVVGPASMK